MFERHARTFAKALCPPAPGAEHDVNDLVVALLSAAHDYALREGIDHSADLAALSRVALPNREPIAASLGACAAREAFSHVWQMLPRFTKLRA
jgi:hypothetical protein